MQLEVSEISVEQLGNGQWYSEVSARIRGRDLGPRSQKFQESNHVLLFEAISAWFSEFLPPADPAPAKGSKKVKVHA